MADGKTTPAADDSKSWKGSCLCTKVKFVALGKPQFVGLCHCTVCARSGGTDRALVASWPKSKFVVSDGKEHLKSFAAQKSTRYFCQTCGCTVYTEPAGGATGGGAINCSPTLFTDQSTASGGSSAGMEGLYRIPSELAPTSHVHYGSSCLLATGVKDGSGLPLFKDTPKEMGGSGEVINES